MSFRKHTLKIRYNTKFCFVLLQTLHNILNVIFLFTGKYNPAVHGGDMSGSSGSGASFNTFQSSSSSSSHSGFGSATHQASFSPNTGYKY